jgi:ectoine hydroxylase-related dioxygenase (phytanoyl-CoA dioxygenase family)
MGRYSEAELEAFAETVRRDGYCVIPGLIPAETVQAWQAAFAPLLTDHISREGHLENRGSARYYVTLPFKAPFADPAVYENDDVLGVVERLVGKDGVMCQLATDTPMLGSDFQDVHKDTQALFPETGMETPAFQLAVNFPLVDVTLENGPIEIAKGTHMIPKAEGMAKIASGESPLDPVPMKAGDVMVRDVRGLHRGTPNKTQTPRPMVVLGYSRRWLFRPEVQVRIPRAEYEKLSDRAKFWLRFNPVVETVEQAEATEVYQAFAY